MRLRVSRRDEAGAVLAVNVGRDVADIGRRDHPATGAPAGSGLRADPALPADARRLDAVPPAPAAAVRRFELDTETP